MTSLTIVSFDWAVFVVYIVGVFGFGIYMSRRDKGAQDYYQAGRQLPWYAIALSLFATNISSGSLVGLAGDGYRVGMAVGTLEWGAVLGLLLLAYVFLPFYRRSGVYTTPEFLEKRYNLTTRILFGTAILLFEMLIFLPFLLYAGGLVVEVMFGIPLTTAVIVIAVFVGVYTTYGGLGAVVWTDVLQGIVMLVGGSLIVLLGLREIGGFGALFTQAEGHMHVCLPADHPDFPFPGTMIGGFFLISVYFWCQNQTIVQRSLGARSLWDAQMGTVAACFIKLVSPFVIVLPGVIAAVLLPDLEKSDQALPALIAEVIPAGLRGIIIAAVAASLMSSADSAINSWATIFTFDFYQRLMNPKASEQQLVRVGRMVTILLLTIAVIRAPMLRENDSILQYLLNALAYISVPVVVVFLIGIFWWRATAIAATITFIGSPFICYMSQYNHQLLRFGSHPMSMVYWIPIATVLSSLLFVGISFLSRAPSFESIEGVLWSHEGALGSQLRGGIGDPGQTARYTFWTDHRCWAVLSLVLLGLTLWVLR